MNLRAQFAVVLVCAPFAGGLRSASAQEGPPPPHVVRGPYLQLASPTSIVVKWRTPEPNDSRVRFGAEAGQLDSIVDDPVETTEHEVRLDGLDPDTRYYYSIGTTERDLVGDDVEHFFVTVPEVDSQTPIRVWVLGDSGTANPFIKDVRDAYVAFTADRRTDLWLMLGDNSYRRGWNEDYQCAVFDVFPEFLKRSVLWPSLGNHDVVKSAPGIGPYFDIFTLPTEGEAGGVASGTESYYSFDHANVHFICVDSSGSDRSPAGKMLTWIREDCAATTQEWMVAFWHHAPYSKGTHNSDQERPMMEMRERVLPILEDAGADLVLTGHSHTYERSYLLRGHYGHSRTVTEVTPSSSSPPRSMAR